MKLSVTFLPCTVVVRRICVYLQSWQRLLRVQPPQRFSSTNQGRALSMN